MWLPPARPRTITQVFAEFLNRLTVLVKGGRDVTKRVGEEGGVAFGEPERQIDEPRRGGARLNRPRSNMV
jgi:hypothetical protein